MRTRMTLTQAMNAGLALLANRQAALSILPAAPPALLSAPCDPVATTLPR